MQTRRSCDEAKPTIPSLTRPYHVSNARIRAPFVAGRPLANGAVPLMDNFVPPNILDYVSIPSQTGRFF